MTRDTVASRALWQVLALAALLSGLVLMHGLGFGHGAPATSAPDDAVVSTAPAHAAPEGSEHVGLTVDPGAQLSAGAGGGADPRSHGGGPDHQSLAQMCLGVLAGVVLTVFLVLRRRGGPAARSVRTRRVGEPLLPRLSRPPERPSIYRLCVMRT